MGRIGYSIMHHYPLYPRKVYDELNDLYFSQNIVRVIKSWKNEVGVAWSMHGGEERHIQGFGGKI